MENIIKQNVIKNKKMNISDDFKIKKEKYLKIDHLINICKKERINITNNEIKEISKYFYEENNINYDKLYNYGMKIGVNKFKSIIC